jgi:hypothetical protein
MSFLSFEKLKEGVVRAKENFEDLTAEVKSEIRNKTVAEDFASTQETEPNAFTGKVR